MFKQGCILILALLSISMEIYADNGEHTPKDLEDRKLVFKTLDDIQNGLNEAGNQLKEIQSR